MVPCHRSCKWQTHFSMPWYGYVLGCSLCLSTWLQSSHQIDSHTLIGVFLLSCRCCPVIDDWYDCLCDTRCYRCHRGCNIHSYAVPTHQTNALMYDRPGFHTLASPTTHICRAVLSFLFPCPLYRKCQDRCQVSNIQFCPNWSMYVGCCLWLSLATIFPYRWQTQRPTTVSSCIGRKHCIHRQPC